MIQINTRLFREAGTCVLNLSFQSFIEMENEVKQLNADLKHFPLCFIMLSFAIRSDKLKIEKADLWNLPECNACITTHASTTFCCYCFLGSSYVNICDKRDCRGGKSFQGMKGYLQIHLSNHICQQLGKHRLMQRTPTEYRQRSEQKELHVILGISRKKCSFISFLLKLLQ